MADQFGEDLALAQGVLRREPGAFESLYQRHMPAVYALALKRLGYPAAAEDAVQETFIEAVKSVESYRGEAPLGAWLMTIARRAAAGQAASAGRERTEVNLAARPVEDLRIGQAERHELVELALGGLALRERRALVGYYGKGKSIEEVAEREEVSTAAVHSLLQRARDKFRAAFERLAGER